MKKYFLYTVLLNLGHASLGGATEVKPYESSALECPRVEVVTEALMKILTKSRTVSVNSVVTRC